MMESWYITAELWEQSQTMRGPLLTFCGGHVPQTSVVLEVGPPFSLFIHSRLETWTQTQIHILSVDCIWVAIVFSAVKTSYPSPVWCTYTLYHYLCSDHKHTITINVKILYTRYHYLCQDIHNLSLSMSRSTHYHCLCLDLHTTHVSPFYLPNGTVWPRQTVHVRKMF